MTKLYLTWMTLFAPLLCTGVTAQTTYYVATDGADDNMRDGLSPTTAWASLAYACEQVPGNLGANDTIKIGPGLFIATEAATPEPGTVIEGAGMDQTTIRTSQDWEMLNRPLEPTWEDYIISFEKFPLGYAGQQTTNFTVRDFRMESTLTNLTNGGIYFRDTDDVLLERLHIEDFAWSAIHLIAVNRVEVRDCFLKNANRTEDTRFMGSIYGYVVKNSSFHHNIFRNTVPGDRQWGVGYKGGIHENCDIHDNDFTTGTGFDIEIPFEQERGLRIYNNTFNRTVSVPKGGPNGDPATRGFDYSIWIYDNYFTNGYDIEGPRGYMEVSGNFFDVQNDNGRCIATFGGDITEPQKIHHNVAVGIDRSFMWANAVQDSVDFYNNTLYYEDAEDRAAQMIDIRTNALGWKIKNNLLVSPDAQPRPIGGAVGFGSTEFEGNLVINATDATVPAGNWLNEDPGLNESGAVPDKFYAPASATSFVVDRGVDVGFPFEGAAPDIGAYEFDASLPIELLLFTGRVNKEMIRLNWSIGAAIDFSHFEVEELLADMPNSWQSALPQVPYKVGQTDFSQDLDWTESALHRTFRLKMVDLDGTITYAEALTLHRPRKTADHVVVFPNPTTERLSFRAEMIGAYRIYAASGTQVARGGVQPGMNSLDVGQLASGTYRLVLIERSGRIRSAGFVR